MKHVNNYQRILVSGLLFVLILVMLIAASKGSYKILVADLFSQNLNVLQKIVLFDIRLPRVLLAAFVGASLSLSGACLQGLFRNPLADPGLIGVSAGAALGATTYIVVGSNWLPNFLIGPYLLPISSIIGSALVIVVLFFITRGFGKEGITYLLLAGIAVNAFAGVGIGFLTYISDDSELRGLTFWTMGSFGGSNWSTIGIAMLVISLTSIWIIRDGRKLDILQLGEAEAFCLGIDIKKLRFNVIISSAIIVGISVSLSGMIGFVGLIVPHLVRMIGGVNHNYVIPGSAIAGATIMVMADLISRTLIKPAELPVGLITSAIGSPFFLYLIFRMRQK